MIENDRSRVDIIDQLYATRKAIKMADIIFMKNYLASTVSDVIRTVNKKKKIGDFMDSICRFIN